MAQRKRIKVGRVDGQVVAKVYRDSETREFSVHTCPADECKTYYTDDEADAFDTGGVMFPGVVWTFA